MPILDQSADFPLPHWKQVARLPEEELARLDIAFVQFVNCMGLPGSERLNPHGCMRKLSEWTAQTKAYTDKNLPQFRRKPKQFHNSEAYFRSLCLTTVLQREFGVRYDMAKVPLDVPFELEDTTVHGIICGQGGTCVSLPVLYAAVGRGLGYPIKLVHAWVNETVGHGFARWDGYGEQFNIETTGDGFSTPPDAHFRTGKFAMMTPEIERKGRHLLSQTPREELSSFLYERAMRWRDLDKRVFAAEALAWSFGLDANNGAHEESLNRFLNEWTGWTKQLQPPGFPDITIGTPRGHRFFPEELPLKYEQEILGLRATERLLLDSEYGKVWANMRRGEWKGRGPNRATVDYRTDGTSEATVQFSP